jgi:hypothetical protein
MKTICVLIPYFGKWPEWFRLFLLSCRFNPTINWHFFTDCGSPVNPPKNVGFSETSYPDYQEKISARLDIRFTGSPYKLCDLKPALGFIHQDIIAAYDYFGFGDIDVIYGNLRNFLSPEMLTKNLISTHPDRVSGHFCLLKNTEEMRTIFREIPDWKKLLENPQHRGVDESHFTKLFIKHRKHPEWLKRWNARYRDCTFREQCSTVMSHKHSWIDGSPNYPEIWEWAQGALTANGHEMMYLHFMNWKSGRWHNRSGETGKAPWESLDRLVQAEDSEPERFWIDYRRGFINQP